jgi:mono/diheme cytochrome c family protein
LVQVLADPNGWRRETAQRLLVERADRSVVPALEALARSGRDPAVRLHALWTLEGLDQLDAGLLRELLADSSDKVRATAVRLSERWLREAPESALVRAVVERAADPSADVVLQLALSLGEAGTPRDEALISLLLKPGGHAAAEPHPYLADAIVSGLRGRELEALERVLDHVGGARWPAGAGPLISSLAAAVFREGVLDRIERMFFAIADERRMAPQARLALISGVDRVPGKQVAGLPKSIAGWSKIPDPEVRAAALKLAGALNWPGKTPPRRGAGVLTADERRLLEAGRRDYAVCAACHLPNGQGMIGLAPPLVDSRWVAAPPEVLTRIILHGKKEYRDYPPMPPFSNLDDEQIAAILTYLRSEWGHQASPVTSALVARVRAQTTGRESVWTVEELQPLLPAGNVPAATPAN